MQGWRNREKGTGADRSAPTQPTIEM
ncbi:Protein of unknown function [Escherichia coli D6-113.11]|nr:Protein of unknown function [Escherichia coli D6-113.11]CDU35680.1 Protein of unknown function [Escherichia coli D6-113.11]